MADFEPVIVPQQQSQQVQPQQGGFDAPGSLFHGLEANAYGLGSGVLQMTSLPAKAVSAGLKAILPESVGKYVASPADIQRSYEDINRVYQQGTTPGMGLSHLVGAAMATPLPPFASEAGQGFKAAAGAIGAPGFMQLGAQAAGLLGGGAVQGGILGAMANQPGLGESLTNPEGMKTGAVVGAALAPIQALASHYLTSQSAVTKAISGSKDVDNLAAISQIASPHIDQVTGNIDLTGLADAMKTDPNAAQTVINLKVIQSLQGLAKTIENLQGGAGESTSSQLAGMAAKAGIGSAIGGGITSMLGMGWRPGALAGGAITSTPAAFSKIAQYVPLQRILTTMNELPQSMMGSDLANYLGGRFTDYMTKAGILMSVTPQGVHLNHKDESIDPVIVPKADWSPVIVSQQNKQ